MTQIREGGVEIPAGMKLVPIEPTEAIGDAMHDAIYAIDGMVLSIQELHAAYRAALAAYTPTPSPEIAEQPMGEEALALNEARSLAVSLFNLHYRDDEACASERATWKPLDDLRGIISQIDNMTSGLSRTPKPANPAPNLDPGTPAYEAARGRLAAALLKLGESEPKSGFTEMAEALLKGELYEVQTWVALQLLAKPADPTSVAGERMREAFESLRIMSKQKLSSEMDEQDRDDADWQGSHDWFCLESRDLLAALTTVNVERALNANIKNPPRPATGQPGFIGDHASARSIWEAAERSAQRRADDNWNRADYLAAILDQHGIAYDWPVSPSHATSPEAQAQRHGQAIQIAEQAFRKCYPSGSRMYAPDTWAYDAIETALALAEPIPMILHCPTCHTQHIDEPDEYTPEWDNPPHRSHLCHACGCIWRPADVPTEGVAQIATRGKADTKPADPTSVAGERYEAGFADGASAAVDPKLHHRAIMASVRLGYWMSAALDDPAVCEAMKTDIREWFSAGEPQPGWCAALATNAPDCLDGNAPHNLRTRAEVACFPFTDRAPTKQEKLAMAISPGAY
ncbi:MAG TPA: hypothetical protein VF637_13435, partial [Sphingomicrobium sp.]